MLSRKSALIVAVNILSGFVGWIGLVVIARLWGGFAPTAVGVIGFGMAFLLTRIMAARVIAAIVSWKYLLHNEFFDDTRETVTMYSFFTTSSQISRRSHCKRL